MLSLRAVRSCSASAGDVSIKQITFSLKFWKREKARVVWSVLSASYK